MSARQIHNKQKGLTLVELMIAVVLGLILVAGVIQIFVTNKQTNRVTEAQSRLQENARFALEVLTRDIRSAGYSGCRAIERMNVNQIANTPVPTQMGENTIVMGSEADSADSWSPALPTELGTVVGGTDVITLQHGTSCGATLIENIGSSNGDIKVSSPNSCNIATAGSIFMIADCEDAHIFRATTGSTSQNIIHKDGNQTEYFCKSYNTVVSENPDEPDKIDSAECATGESKLYNYDAEVFKFSALTYFIRLGANGDPALWAYDQTVATGASNPAELVEGIEDLQVLYGADDNDDDIVDRYVTAKVINDANDWNKVISAQINILAQTLDENLTTSSQSVDFNGSTKIAEKGRLMKVFSSTIAIRNRVQ